MANFRLHYCLHDRSEIIGQLYSCYHHNRPVYYELCFSSFEVHKINHFLDGARIVDEYRIIRYNWNNITINIDPYFVGR